MKTLYEKPMAIVEHFSLTQSIANCQFIKIGGNGSSEDVLNDADSTPIMIAFAKSFGFISSGGCSRKLDGYAEGGEDGNTICYHGPVISAFTS